VSDDATAWCSLSAASGDGNGTVTINVTKNPSAESRAATITFAAGTLSKAVAVTQVGAPVELDVTPSSFAAAYTAATYTVAVTSNAPWTAAVSDDATAWCSLSAASGTANGTVTINIAENPSMEPRAATVTFAAGTLRKVVAVTQAARPTPTYAASTQTWTFGSSPLVWSDAIQIPNCNKTSFTNSTDDPQCRSYTDGESNTWYYYNWAYVSTNAATLCPAPWRVPTREDFVALMAATSSAELVDDWGYGGFADGSNVNEVDSFGYFWSSKEDRSNSGYLYYGSGNGNLGTFYRDKHLGYQVRCVK
jgi:uncharacterized protein (TIGR02145 family)